MATKENCVHLQFFSTISQFERICYNINVLRQTACLLVNSITVDNFAFLLNCTRSGPGPQTLLTVLA